MNTNVNAEDVRVGDICVEISEHPVTEVDNSTEFWTYITFASGSVYGLSKVSTVTVQR